VDVVASAGMVVQEDLVETIHKVKAKERETEKTPAVKKERRSDNNHSVGREAEVAVDSVARAMNRVVDAIVIIVAEEGEGDHALTPKVKIREREKVSKRSNGKVATASVVVVDPEVAAAGVVVGEVEGGDTLAVSTAEGLQEDVLKVTVKEAMSKRGEKAIKIASPSPMRALHKQQF